MSTTAESGNLDAGGSAPRGRTALTRERILRAAIEFADEHGVGPLSMRKLAALLGYEAMSLYNHVRNKEDLFEGMLDLVAAEVDLPTADVPWKTAVREIAIAHHAAIVRHRWSASMIAHHFPGPARWQISESVLECLARGGLTDHLRDVGFHAVTLHIVGFTQQQVAYAYSDVDTERAMQRVRSEAPPERYPLMNDHIDYHHDMEHIPGERPDEFTFVLDLILDGLERLRDA